MISRTYLNFCAVRTLTEAGEERIGKPCVKLALARQTQMRSAHRRLYKEIHNCALSGSHDFNVNKSEIKCNRCFILRANELKKRDGERTLAQTLLQRNLWVLPCSLWGQQDLVGTTWDLSFASSWWWICE